MEQLKNGIPLAIEAENMKKILAIDGVVLAEKTDFIKLSAERKNQYLSDLAIQLCNLGFLKVLPPNVFWQSTLDQLIYATDGLYWGSKAKNIHSFFGLAMLVIGIYFFFFSPITFWYALPSVIFIIYIGNKIRNRQLRNFVLSVALDSPHSFVLMWECKLIALQKNTNESGSFYDKMFHQNRWQDIVLSAVAWDDLMEQKIMTREEYFLDKNSLS